MPSVDVEYNTHSFQTTSVKKSQIITRDIMFEHIADKTLMTKEDSIRHGFSILDDRYSHKIITLRGWLISDTPEHFREHVDTVKGYLRPNEKNLDIETYGGSGEWRRHVASCQSLTIESEHWMSTQSPYEATFLAQPFGKSTTLDESNTWTSQSSSLTDEPITITGSYKASPIITIEVNTANGLTKVKLENETNDDWIEVEPDGGFSNSDTLIIDCENETVKIEGSDTDFLGIFPRFDPGSNTFHFTVTGAGGSLDYDLKIAYYAKYL